MNPTHPAPQNARLDREVAEARYGLRVAARLSRQTETLPHDIGERLRFARERALERARAAAPRAATPPVAVGGGQLALGGWGWRLAMVAPALALLAGLWLIHAQLAREQRAVVADIDAALLADDLPPNAYTDPGFAEFLRSPGS